MILQLTNEALEQKLKKLEPCYILASQETLLLQEARQRIWSTAQQAGFQTRHIVELSIALDWEQLHYQYNTHDLFAKRQLIEFHCPQLPNESVGQKLAHFIKAHQVSAVLNRIIVLSYNQLKANMPQPAWLKELAQVSDMIFLLSPTQQTFEQWIQKRLHQRGLSLHPEAVRYLAQGTEGNLNVAIQSIEKLALIYDKLDQQVSQADVQSLFEDEAQFAIFSLNEAILQSHHARVMRILSHFEVSNVAPALVLGCALRVLRLIAALYYGQSQNSWASLFKEHNIWSKHQAAFKRAIARIQKSDLPQLFNHAHQIDRYIKGVEQGSPWQHLQHFCLQLSHAFQ